MNSNSELTLPRSAVATVLASYGESCSEGRIGYCDDLNSLAERVSGSRCWDEGEVFVFASAHDCFVVMKQIAPASCEMFTVSNTGFKDVITGYRYTAGELERLLAGYSGVIV